MGGCSWVNEFPPMNVLGALYKGALHLSGRTSYAWADRALQMGCLTRETTFVRKAPQQTLPTGVHADLRGSWQAFRGDLSRP